MIWTSNTAITTLYGWANGVIQGNANVAPNDVLTAMIALNNLAVANSSSGTIADCIEAANGNKPPTSSTIAPTTPTMVAMQKYLLNLNTQAMIALTETYHIPIANA